MAPASRSALSPMVERECHVGRAQGRSGDRGAEEPVEWLCDPLEARSLRIKGGETVPLPPDFVRACCGKSRGKGGRG